MTASAKLAFGVAGLAVLGAGAMLWQRYGSLVYFDTLAAAFISCFM